MTGKKIQIGYVTVLTRIPIPDNPPIAFPALPMPDPVADTRHDFVPLAAGLLHRVRHEELVAIIPIPFRDFVFPVPAVVLGEALAVRVHKRAHEPFVVKSGGVDGGNDRQVLRTGWAEGHFFTRLGYKSRRKGARRTQRVKGAKIHKTAMEFIGGPSKSQAILVSMCFPPRAFRCADYQLLCVMSLGAFSVFPH